MQTRTRVFHNKKGRPVNERFLAYLFSLCLLYLNHIIRNFDAHLDLSIHTKLCIYMSTCLHELKLRIY